MAYHRYYKVDTRIARIFNTYGPRMQLNDGRVIPNFMKQALRGEDLTVYGDGSQTEASVMSVMRSKDFCAWRNAHEHLPVNIGNPSEFTILECAKRVLAVTGSKSTIRYEELPQDDPKQRRPDITKAKPCWDGNQRSILKPGYKCPSNISKTPLRSKRRRRTTSKHPYNLKIRRSARNPALPVTDSRLYSDLLLLHFRH